MKGMQRVALMMGLVAMTAVSIEAAEVQGPGDEITTQVYVVNNYLTDVRVYAEDAHGKLHKLGRVARGGLQAFSVPDGASDGEFRIKVYPTTPVWSPVGDEYGVKTNPLRAERDREVRLWLEADLTQSVVEIDRG